MEFAQCVCVCVSFHVASMSLHEVVRSWMNLPSAEQTGHYAVRPPGRQPFNVFFQEASPNLTSSLGSLVPVQVNHILFLPPSPPSVLLVGT